jgi:hypothetical protein
MPHFGVDSKMRRLKREKRMEARERDAEISGVLLPRV